MRTVCRTPFLFLMCLSRGLSLLFVVARTGQKVERVRWPGLQRAKSLLTRTPIKGAALRRGNLFDTRAQASVFPRQQENMMRGEGGGAISQMALEECKLPPSPPGKRVLPWFVTHITIVFSLGLGTMLEFEITV